MLSKHFTKSGKARPLRQPLRHGAQTTYIPLILAKWANLFQLSITERKPRLALIGHAAVGRKENPVVPQDGDYAMKMRKLVIGPVAPTERQISQ